MAMVPLRARSWWPRWADVVPALCLLYPAACFMLWYSAAVGHAPDRGGGFEVARFDVAKLGQAVELFIQRADQYGLEQRMPRSLRELIVGPPELWNRWEPILRDRQIPDDPWGHPYVYRILDEETQTFVIICYGKDGRPGGSAWYDRDFTYPRDAGRTTLPAKRRRLRSPATRNEQQ